MFYASGPIDMCVSSFLIDSGVLLLGLPGSPGGESLFFASPKKSNQKKGDPVRRPFASLRACCGAQKKRGHAQTRCAQTSACPDPLFPALLTSSPRVWGGGFECGFGVSPHPRPLPEGKGVKPKSCNALSLCSLSLWERVRVRASPNPNPNSLPPPVLAGLEKVEGDGLKNLDVRRLRSRLVSRFSGSFNFFKEPQSGPDCGSPFLCLLSFGDSQKKVSCRRATPGTPRKAEQLNQSTI